MKWLGFARGSQAGVCQLHDAGAGESPQQGMCCRYSTRKYLSQFCEGLDELKDAFPLEEYDTSRILCTCKILTIWGTGLDEGSG